MGHDQRGGQKKLAYAREDDARNRRAELCCIKERRTETEGDGTAYQDKIEIESVADHRCPRPTYLPVRCMMS